MSRYAQHALPKLRLWRTLCANTQGSLPALTVLNEAAHCRGTAANHITLFWPRSCYLQTHVPGHWNARAQTDSILSSA